MISFNLKNDHSNKVVDFCKFESSLKSHMRNCIHYWRKTKLTQLAGSYQLKQSRQDIHIKRLRLITFYTKLDQNWKIHFMSRIGNGILACHCKILCQRISCTSSEVHSSLRIICMGDERFIYNIRSWDLTPTWFARLLMVICLGRWYLTVYLRWLFYN